MLKSVYPFHSIHAAINFYLNNNPARQRYQNHAEPEYDSADAMAEKMGGSPHDIWAAVTLAIESTLRSAHTNQKWAFIYRHLTPRDLDVSFPGIAAHMRLPKNLVRKYVKELEDVLLEEMIERGLIDEDLRGDLKNFQYTTIRRHN